jgi:hypothetical protein
MLTSTTRILTATVIAFLCALAAYALLWYLIDRNLDRAASENALRAQSFIRGLELSGLEKTLADTAKDRARLASFVVTDDGITEFLALVEGAVRSQGLTASTRAVEIEPGEGRFESLKLTIAANGGYDELKRLIVLLETMPFSIDMRTVRLDRASGNEWTGVFTFAVTKERSP